MYKDSQFSSILIVKTSSLGDIVQSFPVLSYLRRRFPNATIDWAVSSEFESLVASHPHVSRAVSIDMKGSVWRSFWNISKKKYDLLFDLQGNCKSGLVTFFARAKVKVGFGFASAREWPNAFFTKQRFEVSRAMNIRLFNLALPQRFFQDTEPFVAEPFAFKISAQENEMLQKILAESVLQNRRKIMVCPGSKWPNKQIAAETMCGFLSAARMQDAAFLLMWGSSDERLYCQKIQEALPGRCVLVDRLTLPLWQNLMDQMDLVIAVDSSALHLCATTKTPTFSFFGPTSLNVFKPIGDRHAGIQGRCPYGRSFEKQCPVLRTCPTGACIKNLEVEQIEQAFRTKDP